MERWALVSGLHGDLDLYERIQSDLKKQRGTAHLFVLGDMISPDHNCDALLTRLRQPKRGDLQPTASMDGGKSNYWSTTATAVSK